MPGSKPHEISGDRLAILHSILQYRKLGWTYRQIADHFNEHGYAMPSGKSWNKDDVKNFSRRFTESLAKEIVARQQRVTADAQVAKPRNR